MSNRVKRLCESPCYKCGVRKRCEKECEKNPIFIEIIDMVFCNADYNYLDCPMYIKITNGGKNE